MTRLEMIWKDRIAARLAPGFFLRNVSTVAAGTILAQGIAIAAAPILTRMFTPGDFGVQAIFISLVDIFVIVLTLQYDMAIILPSEDQQAKQLAGLALRLAGKLLIWSLPVAFLFLIIPGLNLPFWKNIPPYVVVMALVSAFVLAVKKVLNYWNIRQKSFLVIAIALISGALLAAIFKISAGYFMARPGVLITGVLLSHCINILFQVKLGRNEGLLKEGLAAITAENRYQEVFREYSDFPKFRLPQSLLNVFGKNIPVILLISLLGPAVGGFYALANRVVNLPGILISESIKKVFYQKASEFHVKGTGLFRLILKTTLGLAVVGLIPFGALIIFSPWLFGIVFGPEWRMAGIYASYLAIWMYVVFCNTPVLAAIPVLRRQRRYLFFNLGILVIISSAVIVGTRTGQPLKAVMYLAAAGTLCDLALILDVHAQARRIENSRCGKGGYDR